MILPIITEPNPVLHQKTELIPQVTPEIRQLAENMRETMHNAAGIGLAAPQIGQSISLCVLEFPPSKDYDESFPFLALINPRLTWKSLRQDLQVEACLSIPGLEGAVKRALKVRVKAKNLDDETVEIRAEGLLARVLQHEIDHLQGILFTSLVLKKDLIQRKIRNYPRI